jgi:hypothetical protein
VQSPSSLDLRWLIHPPRLVFSRACYWRRLDQMHPTTAGSVSLPLLPDKARRKTRSQIEQRLTIGNLAWMSGVHHCAAAASARPTRSVVASASLLLLLAQLLRNFKARNGQLVDGGTIQFEQLVRWLPGSSYWRTSDMYFFYDVSGNFFWLSFLRWNNMLRLRSQQGRFVRIDLPSS